MSIHAPSENPIRDVERIGAPGRPAGLFWLHGRCRLAAHGSAAEERLLGSGAVPIATLRFDRDPREGRGEGPVQRIPARAFALAAASSG